MGRFLDQERSVPTLDDVARQAGVSRATVSRVINGVALVAPETISTVQAAVSELGYRPNRAARALVTRRTGVVAVVVPEANERVFNDPFFPQAYHGALQGFGNSDVQVVLAIAQPGDPPDRMLRYLDSGHVDGAIVVSHHGPALATALARMAIPVVFVGDPETPDLPYVDLDQVDASRQAIELLIERGRRRIATITGSLDMAAARRRLQGYQDALAAAGLEPGPIEVGDFTQASGRSAVARMIAGGGSFDAVFAANDLMAAGALYSLAEAGLRVPGDVAVIGFDNSVIAEESNPGLTTMTNPAAELSRVAAQMLTKRLAGETVEPVILPSHPVMRGSV